MRKTCYTTAATLEADARAWMASLDGYLRHRGPGNLADRADRADRAELAAAALLVLDLQRYFLDPEAPAFLPAAPALAANIGRLVDAFRQAGRPVIFTRHLERPGAAGMAMRDFWGRQLDAAAPWSELAGWAEAIAGHGAVVIDKPSYSAFHETDLAERLRSQQVTAVVLCGLMTHLCVETSARHAFLLGWRPVVVADATAAPDLDLHLGALRALGQGFGRVVLADEVTRTLARSADKPASLSPSTPRPLGPSDSPGGFDLIVVGAGPAGLAAALQARRQGMSVCLVEATRPGGLLRAANRVENYPGFPGGIDGQELVDRMLSQATAMGVECTAAEVRQVMVVGRSGPPGVAGRTETETDGCDDQPAEPGRAERRLLVELADGRRLAAGSVALATGTRPQRLGVVGEEEAAAAGRVFYRVDRALEIVGQAAEVAGGANPVLDGVEAAERSHPRRSGRGAEWLVAGGGDCAFDQALRLWRHGHQVAAILVRGPAPRALSLLQERVRAWGIPVRLGVAVYRLSCERAALDTAAAHGCRLTVHTEGPGDGRELGELTCDFLLVAVGRAPSLPRIVDHMAEAVRAPGGAAFAAERASAAAMAPAQIMTPDLASLDALGRGALPGLYFAGDCRRGWLRQTAVAVGDGIAVAMDAQRYLSTGLWR